MTEIKIRVAYIQNSSGSDDEISVVISEAYFQEKLNKNLFVFLCRIQINTYKIFPCIQLGFHLSQCTTVVHIKNVARFCLAVMHLPARKRMATSYCYPS